MLAYSDNYKHNNLIYFQVVLIDVTTNGSTTLKNPEAGKTCKNKPTFCLLVHNLPPTPTQDFRG